MGTHIVLGLVVWLTLYAIPLACGYNTRYATYTSSTPSMAFDRNIDICAVHDTASHMAMPLRASHQQAIRNALLNPTTDVPLGGGAEQASCSDAQCNWIWNRGLYSRQTVLFYKGIVYQSKSIGGPVTYANFASLYPVSFSNQSYWSERVVVMQPSGLWKNNEVGQQYRTWICEYYEYTRDDTASFLLPSYPNGDPLVLKSASNGIYSYCGATILYDSQGRWLYANCSKSSTPWWVGLLIAVILYLVVVGSIILVWCCRSYSKRQAEELARQKTAAEQRDNQGGIPSQSEVGSRYNSALLSRGTSRSFSNRSASSRSSSSSSNDDRSS